MKSGKRLVLGLALVLSAPVVYADTYIVWRSVPGATQPSPEDRQRAFNLARQSYDLLMQHDIVGGEAKLRDAIAILPDKALYHFNLACILTARNQVDAALDELQRATDDGFTDFRALENDAALNPLHDQPRYKELLAHKTEICHKAARRAVEELKQQFGKDYLYEVDEDEKLIFATNTDQATLDVLKSSLVAQARSQQEDLFANKSDEFIRVVVPSLADYHRMMRLRGVLGIYEDESRTLLAERMGQVMTHEFTHALHAADQRAVGQEHPIWLREGLASTYEAGEFVNDKLVPRDNFRLAYVQSAARRSSLIPFDRLLLLTSQDFLRGPNLAYGESSSLLLYLYEQNLLRKFYDHYKETYAADPTGKRALEEITGKSLTDLQNAWQAWMLQRKAPSLVSRLGGPNLGVHFGDAIDGLKVALVVPRSPAFEAGIKPGDVIVAFDGKDVRDYNSFAPLLADHRPGDAVKIKLRREGKYLDVPVTLGQR